MEGPSIVVDRNLEHPSGHDAESMRANEEDDTLLLRFLDGELDAVSLAALELRLDEEPALQRRLGSLARRQQEETLAVERIDRTTRLTGRGLVTRRARPTPRDTALEIGPVIGEGGMAVVHLGRQHSVGRDVAVKTVKTPGTSSTTLLEEAWVTGQLEHPNIVPIHDIVMGEDGRAQVVLKHIEGSSWSELAAAPDEVRRRFHVDDPLEWHLRVLVQVCQALRFAHSRAIVHRDVKPANVMIGRFDEVYLLDWGLAISTEPSDRLPTLTTSFGIAGSPAYMAPEQLEALPLRVGLHTDVYLLGATLFELIAGEPPHAGRSLRDIRDRLLAGVEPPLPDDAPPELVAIVRRAMATEPSARFSSVQRMREAIESFLEHRGSQALARRAADRATVMYALHQRRDDDGAERAFAEATFGYRMALDAWEGNQLARRELEELVRNRVGQLLALRAPESARRALAVLDEPDLELVRRVDEALAKEARDRKTLKRLVRDEDRRVGHRVRRGFVVVLGTAWALFWTTMGLWPPQTTTPLLVALLAFLLPCTVAVLYLRRDMLEVRLNRYISWILFAMFVAQILWLGGAAHLGVSMHVAELGLFLFWSMACATGAATVDVRVLPAAIVYALAFIACVLEPRWLPWAIGGSGWFILANTYVVNVAVAKRPRLASDPPPSSRQ